MVRAMSSYRTALATMNISTQFCSKEITSMMTKKMKGGC